MIQGPSNPIYIAVLIQQHNRVDFPAAVRPDILRQPKGRRSPFYIVPHRLPRPMLFPVIPTLENPIFPGVPPEIVQQRHGQAHAPPLPGFRLGDPENRLQLIRFQAQDIRNPEPCM